MTVVRELPVQEPPVRRRKVIDTVVIHQLTIQYLDDDSYRIKANPGERLITESNFPDSPAHKNGPQGGYLEVRSVLGRPAHERG